MSKGIYQRTAAHYPPERNRKISETMKGKKKSADHAQHIGESHKGKKISDEHKEALRKASVKKFEKNPKWGFKKGHNTFLTEEHYLKLKEKFSGEGSYAWKGGITPENKKARNSLEYRQWRTAVFVRDDFTCMMPGCGVRGHELQANHIKKFSTHKELRLEVKNGITLCKPCHKSIHSKEEQYEKLFTQIIEIVYG